METKFYALVEAITNIVGRPLYVMLTSVFLLGFFIVWLTFGMPETTTGVAYMFISIITLIIALIIQVSQNADTRALHIKLDEIIKALPKADNKNRAIEKAIKKGEIL